MTAHVRFSRSLAVLVAALSCGTALGAPSQLTVSSATQTLAPGSCSKAVRITARDSSGYPALAAADVPVALSSSSATTQFFSDSSCATGISSRKLLAGSSSVVFYFKDVTSGQPTLTAAAAGLSSATQAQLVTPLPTDLAITSGTEQLAPGRCSDAVTVEARDSDGYPSGVGAAKTLSLSSTSTSTQFFSDPACATAITSRTLAAGASTATFYFKDGTAGLPKLTVGATGLNSADETYVITPAANALVFTNAPQTLTRSGCSSGVYLQVVDATGNAATVASRTTVNLTSTSSTTTFYSDWLCTVPTTTGTLQAGDGWLDVYFRDTGAGSITLTAAASGLQSVSQAATILPPPSQLRFDNNPRTTPAGVCSGVLYLETYDSAGYLSPVSAQTTLSLSSTSSGTTFYADSDCTTAVTSRTLEAGESYAELYFKDSTLGSPTFTASASGLSSATQTETVSSAPTRLRIASDSLTVTAGVCNGAVTIETRDSAGYVAAVAAATTVGLSSSSGTMRFYSDNACANAITQVPLPSGSSSVNVYFADSSAGTPDFIASATGLASASQKEIITPGPSALSFNETEGSVPAGSCIGLDVVTRDANGNSAVSAADFSISLASSSTTTTFYSDSSCSTAITSVGLPANSSGVGFYLKETTAGTRTTVTATASGFSSATVSENVLGALQKLYFTTNPVKTSPASCNQLSFELRDTLNNVAKFSYVSVNLSSTSPTLAFYGNSECTQATTSTGTWWNGGGVGYVYFQDTTPGTPQITLSAPGIVSASQTETITAPASAISFLTPVRTFRAGTCSPYLQLQSVDSSGRPAAVVSDTVINLTSTASTSTFYSDWNCTTPVTSQRLWAGTQNVTFYVSDTVAGSSTITASGTGVGSATQTLNVSAAASALSVSSPAQTVPANRCSGAVSVQSRDSSGLNGPFGVTTSVTLTSSSPTMSFYSDSGCTSAITSLSAPSTASSVSFYFADSTSGAPTLTAAATGLGSTTQTELINAPPSALLFANAAFTGSRSSCNSLNVRSYDSSGNAATSATATTVSFSSSATTTTFYSDSSCTTAVSTMTLPASSSDLYLYVRDTGAGQYTLTASATGLSSATQVDNTLSAATRLSFTTAPKTVRAGSCSGNVRVASKDASGRQVNVTADTRVDLSSSSSSLQFYSNSNCQTPITFTTLFNSNSFVDVYVRDTAGGSPQLTASATGLTSATQTQSVTPPPSRLAFTNNPIATTAGRCGFISFETRDSSARATAVAADTAIALSSSSGTTSVFSDATCTTAASGFTLLAGQSNGALYVRDSNAGTPLFTLSATGLSSDTQTQTYLSPPTRLVFTNPTQTVNVGRCSGTVTVQARDAQGAAAPVATALTVNLSSSAGTTRFFSDPSCTNEVSSVQIGVGGSTANYWFQDSAGGTPTLTAAASGVASATLAHTLVGAPTKLSFATPDRSVRAGSCSGLVRVVSRDSNNRSSAVAADTRVDLTSTSPTLTFYSNSSCTTAITFQTIFNGNTLADFWFKDTSGGWPVVTAAASGLTSTTQTESVAAGPSVLAFTGTPLVIGAGRCSSALSFETRDSNGRLAPVTAATTVSLSSSPATATFFSDSACTTAATSLSLAAGSSSTSFYVKPSDPGALTVTLSASGYLSAQQKQTVLTGPSVLTFTSTPQTAIAAGRCSGQLTVAARDSLGNSANVASNTAVSLSSSAATTRFYSDSACTAQISSAQLSSGTSSTTFYFSDSAGGSLTLTAAATGFTSGTQLATVQGVPSRLAISSAPRSGAAGSCEGAVTVEVRDAAGYAVTVNANTTINLSSSSGATTFYSDPSCTTAASSRTLNSGNSSLSVYYRNGASETITVTASATGLSSASQQELAPSPPAAVAFTNAPRTGPPGTCNSFTVQLRDSAGDVANAIANVPLTVSATASTTTLYSDSSCTVPLSAPSIPQGSSTLTFYAADSAAGLSTVSVGATGINSATSVLTTTLAPARLSFTTNSQARGTGACSSSVTVALRDSLGYAATSSSGITLNLSSSSSTTTFYSSASCTAAVTTRPLSAGSNSVTFFFADTTAGAPTITVSASGLAAASQGQIITAASPHLAFTSAIQQVQVGACSQAVTVRTRDASGVNTAVASATQVDLTSTSGTTTFYSDASCTSAITQVTVAAGSSTGQFYFSDSTTGTATLTASNAGYLSAQQHATLVPAPTRIAFTTTPRVSVLAGACSASQTAIQTVDANGNPSPLTGSSAVSLSSSSGTTTFFSDPSCTNPLSSPTINSGGSTYGFYFKDSTTGPLTLTASVGALSASTQLEVILAPPSRLFLSSTPQARTVGQCSGTVTVQSRNPSGYLVSVPSDVTVSLSSSSTGTTFFADSACTAAITDVTLFSGSSSVGFFFKDTTAGTPTFTAAATGLTSATEDQFVTAAPSQLLLSRATQTLTPGSCSGTTTVQTRDSAGNLTNVAVATNIALSSSSATTVFYSNSSCTTPISAITLPQGSSSLNVWWNDSASGTPTLTAAATGFSSATQSQVVTAPASVLAINSAPQRLSVGGCSAALVVEARDATGRLVSVPNALPIALASSSTNTTFYSNSSCTTAITSATISAGASNTQLYWADTSAGTPVLTVSATGFGSDSQTETLASPPTQLAFTSTEQLVTTSGCSAALTIEARDSLGGVVPAAAATTVALSSSSPTTTFYSDSACTTQVSSRVLAAGSSALTFYASDSAAGSATLNVVAPGFSPSSQALGFVAPASLIFNTSPQVVSRGSCVGGITLQLRDSTGATLGAGSALPISLSSSSATTTFYSNSSCTNAITSTTLPAGSNSLNFYWSDSSSGTFTLTASSAGVPTAATQLQVVNSTPTLLAFLSGPVRAAPRGCNTLQFETRDSTGRASPVAASTLITPSSTSATTSFFTNSSCTTPLSAFTLASGSSGLFYWSDTNGGAPTLTLAATGVTSAAQTEAVTALPTTLAFTGNEISASVGACTSVTVEARDSLGTPVAVPTATSVSLSSTSAAARFFSDNQCQSTVTSFTLSAGSSSGTVWMNDSSGASSTLTASAAPLSSASMPASWISPSRLRFTNGLNTTPAGSCNSLSFELLDGSGTPTGLASGSSAALTSSSASTTFYSDSGCTTAISAIPVSAGATVVSFWWKDPSGGVPQLTATATGLTPAALSVPLAGRPTQLFVYSQPLYGAPGICLGPFSVEARNAAGWPVGVAAATPVSFTSSGTSATFYSDSACSTAVTSKSLSAGQTTLTVYLSDNTAGTKTLTASAPGFSSGTQTVTLTAPASALAFSSGVQTVTAGVCSQTVQLETRDATGNPATQPATAQVALSASNSTMTFYSDSLCTNPVTAVSIGAGSSSASFYFKDTAAGTPVITAQLSGLGAQSQTEQVGAAASKLRLSPAAGEIPAGQCAWNQLEAVTSSNDSAAVAADTQVTLSSSSTTMTFYADGNCTNAVTQVTLPRGSAWAGFYFKDTTPGFPTVTAQSSVGNTTENRAIGAPPSRLVVTSAPQQRSAGGCSGEVQVVSRDSYGYPVQLPSGSIADLTSTSPTLKFYSNSSCVTEITSRALNNTDYTGASWVAFYFKDTAPGSPQITVSTTGLSSATQREAITGTAQALTITSSAQVLPAGACSGAVYLSARDNLGYPVGVATATTLNLGSTSGSTTFYSDASCSTAVTTAQLGAGSAWATVYFRNTSSGTPTLTASATGLTSASQVETITPAIVPTALAFEGNGQFVTAGLCSPYVAVSLRDSVGYSAAATSATTVSLSSSSSTLKFYSDSSCTSLITSLSINAGQSGDGFYFSDSKAELPTLTATATGLSSAVQTETVTALPSELAFVSAPMRMAAGGCSYQVHVQARESAGRWAGVGSNTDLTFSSDSSTLKFYSDSSCTQRITTQTLYAGGSDSYFYFSDTATGQPTITVSATGLTSATQKQALSGGPSSLVVRYTPQSTSSGSCSQVFVSLRDSAGRDTSTSTQTTISMSSSSGGVTFYPYWGCSGTATSSFTLYPNNWGTWLYVKTTQSGLKTLTASATGLTSGSARIAVIDPPDHIVFATDSTTVSPGLCSGAINLDARNAAGRASPVVRDALLQIASSTSGMEFYDSSDCTYPITDTYFWQGNSQSTLYFRESASGGPLLTATASGLGSTSQYETVTRAASKLQFVTPPQVVAANSCSGVTTVESRDAANAPSPVNAATDVDLSATSTTLVFFEDSACTTPTARLQLPAGATAGHFFFRDAQAGTPQLTAADATGALSSAVQQEQIAPAGQASRVAFATAPQSLTAGSCSAAVTVEMRDPSGNAVPLTNATPLSLYSDSATLRLYADATCTTALSGSVTVAAGSSSATFYVRDTKSGTPQLVAAMTGASPASQVETVSPAAAAAIALTSAAQSVTAGACSAAVGFGLLDPYGNAAISVGTTSIQLASTSATMRFFSDSSCTAALVSAQVGSGGSTGELYFSDDTAGTATVTLSGAALTNATQGETIVAGAPTTLVISGLPGSIPAGTPMNVVVTAKDSRGNDCTGYAALVAVTTSDTAATVPAAWQFTSADRGTHTFKVTFQTAGTQSLTAMDNGSPQLTAQLSNLSVFRPVASALEVSGIPSPLELGVPTSVTVKAVDGSGNLATDYRGTVRFSATDPGAVLPASYAFTSADNGSHTFAGIQLRALGLQRITVTDAANAAISGSQGEINVVQPRGYQCSLDAECASGHCVDSVCCDTACGGGSANDCEACSVAQGAQVNGTCGVVSAGHLCRASTGTCDLAESCDGLATACPGERAPSLQITRSAILTAAVGAPYRYSTVGQVEVSGDLAGAVSYSTCAAVPGFNVDAQTGTVFWTPTAAGLTSVCIQATDGCSTDSYNFDVDVKAQPASPPTAALQSSPSVPRTGELVHFDASQSSADSSTTLVAFEWSFGDGSTGHGKQVSHAYAVAGGYTVKLKVYDALGGTAEAVGAIPVGDTQCPSPPSVRIAADKLTGLNELDVNFSCNCSIPVTLVWDFGDGASSAEQAPSHHYTPGRYHVRLLGVDANGCIGTDGAEVSVDAPPWSPPLCVASVTPAAGSAPLDVTYTGKFVDSNPDGKITSAQWTFEDDQSQSSAPTVNRTYATPGVYRTSLKVVNDHGLACTDAVEVVVQSAAGETPPQIFSKPNTEAKCGEPWHYWAEGDDRPVARGSRPMSWKLGKVSGGVTIGAPEGMSVDPATGKFGWTPQGDARTEHVVLVAYNGAGAGVQSFDVNVSCDQAPPAEEPKKGCGCDAIESGTFAAIGLLGMLSRRRRRPTGTKPTREPSRQASR